MGLREGILGSCGLEQLILVHSKAVQWLVFLCLSDLLPPCTAQKNHNQNTKQSNDINRQAHLEKEQTNTDSEKQQFTLKRSAPADAVHLTVVKSCKSETSLAGGSNQTFEKSHAATTRCQQTLKINKVYLPIYGSKLCTHLTGSLRTHGKSISLSWFGLWVSRSHNSGLREFTEGLLFFRKQEIKLITTGLVTGGKAQGMKLNCIATWKTNLERNITKQVPKDVKPMIQTWIHKKQAHSYTFSQ